MHGCATEYSYSIYAVGLPSPLGFFTSGVLNIEDATKFLLPANETSAPPDVIDISNFWYNIDR